MHQDQAGFLYQGRIPLLTFFLQLLPSITASGQCNHLPSERLMGFAPIDSFGIVFNNLIFLMLQSDYFSQSKYSLRRWGNIQLVCFPMKTSVSIFTLDFLLLQHQSRWSIREKILILEKTTNIKSKGINGKNLQQHSETHVNIYLLPSDTEGQSVQVQSVQK